MRAEQNRPAVPAHIAHVGFRQPLAFTLHAVTGSTDGEVHVVEGQADDEATVPGDIEEPDILESASQDASPTGERHGEQGLVKLVGADRVMMGTDYCFDIAYQQPVQIVEQTPGLSADERALILGGTAAKLLAIGT